jgi:hypothetical protein
MFKVEKALKEQAYRRRGNQPEDVWEDDFKYLVSYDANHEYSCEESGCNSEGICRCGRIVSVDVDNSFTGADYFFTMAYEDTGSALDRALDHWFVRKHFADIDWGYDSGGGYYGEELNRVFPNHDGNFFNKASTFENLTPKEKVEFMLEREYGRILPAIQKVEDWELKAVLTCDVLQSQNTHLDRKMFETYKQHYSTLIKRDHKTFQDGTKSLAPLTLRSGKGYQIIDGRHRFEAMTEEYSYQETVITTRATNKKQKDGTVKVVTRKDTKYVDHPFVPVYMWVICPREKA